MESALPVHADHHVLTKLVGSCHGVMIGREALASEELQLLGLPSPRRLGVLTCAAALCWAANGCLVPLPPVEDDRPARPNLSLAQAVPPTSELLVVRQGETVKFSVPIEYSGTGRGKFVFWLNWGLQTQPENAISAAGFPPGQAEIAYSWVVKAEIPSGCQQLTLLVSDNSNFTDDTPENLPKDPTLVAVATWWLNVNPLDGGGTLNNCPTRASSGTGN